MTKTFSLLLTGVAQRLVLAGVIFMTLWGVYDWATQPTNSSASAPTEATAP